MTTTVEIPLDATGVAPDATPDRAGTARRSRRRSAGGAATGGAAAGGAASAARDSAAAGGAARDSAATGSAAAGGAAAGSAAGDSAAAGSAAAGSAAAGSAAAGSAATGSAVAGADSGAAGAATGSAVAGADSGAAGAPSGRGTGGEPSVPIAGILDIRGNHGFVRASGYLAGPGDGYVSAAQIKRYGLRPGDLITGAVRETGDRESGDGEAGDRNTRPGNDRRGRQNRPDSRDRRGLLRVDTVNGMDPDEARRRPEFYKLTPLYPQERLRLETEPQVLTTRVIDLVMPIGKGQRALIVSPPKAGKTMVLQAIANAITRNNPECHLMVVLVDERPEEVTDMQRSVKGEVIASTFDRPPSDHTTVSELSIERAKRLVELGHDVVVLLDSITRLGRAYNNASPASGRILSGGIDSTALYPPKRFLGAARNIENGGSLTIIATAMVDTGSIGDTVLFEEYKSTGNAELRLDRKIAEKRVFPAIDLASSSTRREELLTSDDEAAVLLKLRQALNLDPQRGIEQLLDQLRRTGSNAEFLLRLSRSTDAGLAAAPSGSR